LNLSRSFPGSTAEDRRKAGNRNEKLFITHITLRRSGAAGLCAACTCVVSRNLDRIRAGLKVGGNKDVTVRAFPKLNHLFQTSQTGLISEYPTIEETISPLVLDTITQWVAERTIKMKN
jgi:hypothetical protein